MVDETVTDVNGNIDPRGSTENNNVEEVNGDSPNDEDHIGNNNGNSSGTYTNLDVCFLCAKKSTFICEKCGLVAFCSEACQKVHRPEDFCFPFMVEQRPGEGRFVVAVRDIEARDCSGMRELTLMQLISYGKISCIRGKFTFIRSNVSTKRTNTFSQGQIMASFL